jgi:hypothetical protein
MLSLVMSEKGQNQKLGQRSGLVPDDTGLSALQAGTGERRLDERALLETARQKR